ncbi:hypothetical protein Nos7524_5606 (plasmid) [Nostoc sp. PCC 7524]|uniref:hypothetical protein n=1 Tax=Nostoc sp. (strain ATCC 29411 / PCC 7524) TaxID=28072 RepID=UPI00029F2181|nr:hypothetical protein [Nostoc sp. PCC 7524]AFY51296.1 hypothetical protein Nos7524_5606 [Nostoc sp. PCC 7524]
MTTTKIHLIVGIHHATLLVYSQANCWQFRLISPSGAVFGERKLYYTPEAAEKMGREWIGKGS